MLTPSGPPPPLPDLDELLSYSYGPSPFEEGMTSDDFRQIHRDYGEQVRWWKGFEKAADFQGPGGEVAGKGQTLYIEQTLAEEIRVRVYSAQKELKSVELGLIEVGSAMISCLPDEMELARGDVIVRITRSILRRCQFEPSGNTSDALPHPFVATIKSVLTDSGPLASDEYSATSNGIGWNGTPPVGKVYVEFRAFLAYEFQGELDKLAPMGTDGKVLPQIGSLRLLKPGEYQFG